MPESRFTTRSTGWRFARESLEVPFRRLAITSRELTLRQAEHRIRGTR